MNLNGSHPQHPFTKRVGYNSQPAWFAILPNAGAEFAEHARALERFVQSLKRYFHNDQVLTVVDTTHVCRMADRIYWDRLGRPIVEPYRLNTPMGGILALDFVLRMNPEAYVAILPRATTLARLRDTWYLYHKLKRSSQDADDKVTIVTGSGRRPLAIARENRLDVRFDVSAQSTPAEIWGSDTLMAGGKAATVWKHAEAAMPELTRRIVEELRPTIRGVEAGRVDPKHVFLCLMHLYEATELAAQENDRSHTRNAVPLKNQAFTRFNVGETGPTI